MSAAKYSWQPYESSRVGRPKGSGQDKYQHSTDNDAYTGMSTKEQPQTIDGTTTEDKENDNAQDEEVHDGCTDAAALLVLLYLLFISTLLVGAIVMGFVVVIQYGLVVFVAVCAVVFAMVIVAATMTSIITRDAKLRKARTKIKSWHVTCKEEILKEIENFKEDLAVYRSNNMLLLTNYGETDSAVDEVDEASVTCDSTTCNDSPDLRVMTANETIDHNKQSSSTMSLRKKKQQYRPKSLLFRAAASFTNLSMKKKAPKSSSTGNSQRKSSMKSKRLWRQRKKDSSADDAFRYQNADVV